MAVETVSDALFEDVKTYLDITWTDEALDRKIQSLIRSGKAFLRVKRGGYTDFESDGYPRTLLMEYVRYARDGALDVFENNYKSMILAMQNQRAVNIYEENAIKEQW